MPEYPFQKWMLPYPREEHDVWLMCGNPVALAYDAVESWVRAQNWDPIVQMDEVIESFFSQTFQKSEFFKFDIIRKSNGTGICVLASMPDEIYKAGVTLVELLAEKKERNGEHSQSAL